MIIVIELFLTHRYALFDEKEAHIVKLGSRSEIAKAMVEQYGWKPNEAILDLEAPALVLTTMELEEIITEGRLPDIFINEVLN